MYVFFHNSKSLVSKDQLSYSIYRNIILILSQRGHDHICDIVAGEEGEGGVEGEGVVGGEGCVGGEGGVGGEGCCLTLLLAVYLHLPEPGQVVT